MSTAAVEIPNPPVEEETPAAETTDETTVETPAEGETTTTETPAEGAEGATQEPAAVKAPEIPEETLKAAALKYANSTMAAARRAEQRIEAVRRENAEVKGNLQAHQDFVARLQKGDSSALSLIGFKTVREFIDACVNHGEAKPPSPDDRINDIERRLKEREEQLQAREHEAIVSQEQTRVFTLVDGDKKRFSFVATGRGHDEFWGALREYQAMHSDYFARNGWTDEMVLAVADAVEADLRHHFGAQVPAARPAAKTGATPADTAAAGRNSGKTLTHRGSSGAPSVRERTYASEEELNAAIAEELRAEQLI